MVSIMKSFVNLGGIDCLSRSIQYLIACSPKSCGMLVYKLTISQLNRSESVSSSRGNLRMKSQSSLMNDFCIGTMGAKILAP